MAIKPSSLGAGLFIKKGEAAPVVSSDTVESTPAPAVEPKIKKAIVQVEEGGQSYWKALTLKLDRERYTALKKRGVDLNKTSQTILIEALDLWLKKNG